MAPQYKFTHFNGRGMSEPIIHIFAYLNIPYEDIRVNYEDWAELKLTAPYSKLPMLEVDGKLMNQSKAIARYLARKHNLVGKDEWESFQCDAIVDTLSDLLTEIGYIELIEEEQKKKELMEKFKNKSAPSFMKDMEKLVAQNGGYLVGSKITWADLYVICLIDSMGMDVKENMFSHFEELNKLKEKIYSIPSVAKWIAERPDIEF